ncbi:hypothetical protein A4X09_0g7119, partial [Tilletia walkeri]
MKLSIPFFFAATLALVNIASARKPDPNKVAFCKDKCGAWIHK